MTASKTNFAGEPIHYTGARHTWNNGFRRLWLANGKKDASIINAARRGDLEAVLARVDKMGGVTARMGIARSLIKIAQKLPKDVDAYQIINRGDKRMVTIPSVTWVYLRGKQVAKIDYLPMWGV